MVSVESLHVQIGVIAHDVASISTDIRLIYSMLSGGSGPAVRGHLQGCPSLSFLKHSENGHIPHVVKSPAQTAATAAAAVNSLKDRPSCLRGRNIRAVEKLKKFGDRLPQHSDRSKVENSPVVDYSPQRGSDRKSADNLQLKPQAVHGILKCKDPALGRHTPPPTNLLSRARVDFAEIVGRHPSVVNAKTERCRSFADMALARRTGVSYRLDSTESDPTCSNYDICCLPGARGDTDENASVTPDSALPTTNSETLTLIESGFINPPPPPPKTSVEGGKTLRWREGSGRCLRSDDEISIDDQDFDRLVTTTLSIRGDSGIDIGRGDSDGSRSNVLFTDL